MEGEVSFANDDGTHDFAASNGPVIGVVKVNIRLLYLTLYGDVKSHMLWIVISTFVVELAIFMMAYLIKGCVVSWRERVYYSKIDSFCKVINDKAASKSRSHASGQTAATNRKSNATRMHS